MSKYYLADTCLDGEYSIMCDCCEAPLALIRGDMAKVIHERYAFLETETLGVGDSRGSDYLNGVIAGLVLSLESGTFVGNLGVEKEAV